jgi:predicted flavoprotein YhiN
MAGVIRPLFPARLAEVISRLSGLGERPAASLGDKEIEKLAELIQSVPIHAEGTRGFNEAIVTRGGLKVNEFDPSTMENRKIRGLYAAGEVLDVDAHTGGFNLQIAWSTGRLAGECAAEV